MSDTEAVVAVRFNEMINAGDVDGLATLMSDDHTFIDTTGHAVSGKQACLAAWRGFFDAFPTYRNLFDHVRCTDGIVTIAGRSTCTDHPDLDGPALWTAVIEEALVSEWRVHDDTPATRQRLGLA